MEAWKRHSGGGEGESLTAETTRIGAPETYLKVRVHSKQGDVGFGDGHRLEPEGPEPTEVHEESRDRGDASHQELGDSLAQ